MAVTISAKNRGLNNLNLTKRDMEFVNLIDNELTMFGELMHSIPQQQIIENIKTSARYFYDTAGNAVTETFFLLKSEEIQKHRLEANNGQGFNGIMVQLPSNIMMVKSVNFLNNSGNGLGGDFEKNFDFLSMGMQTGVAGIAPTMLTSLGGYGGIDRDLFVIEGVVRMAENTALRSLFKKNIPFRFNSLTSILNLQGNIKSDVGLHVKCYVPIQNLYNDSLFKRYVISLCHQSLKRKLGGIVVELPSGATMSADEICNKVDDQEKVEEMLRNGSGLGAIFIKRS